MKTGEAAKLLGVDRRTIVLWIDRDELRGFFSPSARQETGGVQRLLTENDLAILNTIRFARTNGNDDWTAIAAVIDSGDLQRDLPTNGAFVDTRMVPEQQARDFAKTAGTLAERDQLASYVVELKERITQLEAARESDKRELIDMNGKLQRALALVELYEQGRLKPPGA